MRFASSASDANQSIAGTSLSFLDHRRIETKVA
jgi:hypothetical protein